MQGIPSVYHPDTTKQINDSWKCFVSWPGQAMAKDGSALTTNGWQHDSSEEATQSMGEGSATRQGRCQGSGACDDCAQNWMDNSRNLSSCLCLGLGAGHGKAAAGPKPQVVRSLGFFLSEAWRLGARLGGGVAGLFGQRRQCRLRGKVNIGQVIIPCVGITHFLY